jgi:hypothetical protein
MAVYPSTRLAWHELGLVPTANMAFWHQYEAGVSGNDIVYDYSGNDHTLTSATPPVLQTDIVYGQPGWYFNGTSTVPLASAAGSIPIRHYFVLAAHEDATFNLNRGLASGHATNDILTSNSSGTTFFNFGVGITYRKSNVVYTEANQQAPMSGNFELIEMTFAAGSVLDGIQVGKQRNVAGRIWKGWWVEHLAFDAVLTETQRRRVLLYYAMRYGVHTTAGSAIPLYFPSSDLIGEGVVSDGGVIRNRFYNVPREWEPVTESYEFEDSNKTFNEFGDDPPRRWEYRYQNVSKQQTTLFDVFNDTARKANPFYFKDPEGYVWSNVRLERYVRDHDAHKRWVHEVNIGLVGYGSVSTYEEPPPPPEAPLTFTGTESATDVELEWT